MRYIIITAMTKVKVHNLKQTRCGVEAREWRQVNITIAGQCM
jgi:hypothetical protein